MAKQSTRRPVRRRKEMWAVILNDIVTHGVYRTQAVAEVAQRRCKLCLRRGEVRPVLVTWKADKPKRRKGKC